MQRKKPLGSGLEQRERRGQREEVGDGPDIDCEGPGAGRITTAALEKLEKLDFLLVFIYLFGDWVSL